MHVRMASRNLRPAFHVDLDVKPFERVQVVDSGDVPCTPFSIEGAVSQIETQAREILGDGQGRRIIAIGGDHTVMLPVMRAVAAEQGPVAVIHFDAHLDTWDNYFGQKITHGTILRRAYEGLLAKDKSIHIGIRSPIYDRMDLTHDENCGFQLLRVARPGHHGCRRDDRRDPPSGRRRPRPSTCLLTSTCSTRRSRPAPAPRRRAAS